MATANIQSPETFPQGVLQSPPELHKDLFKMTGTVDEPMYELRRANPAVIDSFLEDLKTRSDQVSGRLFRVATKGSGIYGDLQFKDYRNTKNGKVGFFSRPDGVELRISRKVIQNFSPMPIQEEASIS